LDWNDYQEKAANFFRSLGLEANTNVTVQGVRTKHDIDVLVTSYHAGFNVSWVVECKHWRTKISKLHVLALREIVHDTGFDRGILLAENGFQSGAIEAANLTNVQVSSLVEMENTASNVICSMKFRDLFDRFLVCKEKYWNIPKHIRIEHGLRCDVFDLGYSGYWVLQVGEDLMIKGVRGEYPIIPCYANLENLSCIIEQEVPQKIESLKELVDVITPLVGNFETKILDCEKKQFNHS
jgi:restriction system protein